MVRFLTFPLKLEQIDHSVYMNLYLSTEDVIKIAYFALETYIWGGGERNIYLAFFI